MDQKTKTVFDVLLDEIKKINSSIIDIQGDISNLLLLLEHRQNDVDVMKEQLCDIFKLLSEERKIVRRVSKPAAQK